MEEGKFRDVKSVSCSLPLYPPKSILNIVYTCNLFSQDNKNKGNVKATSIWFDNVDFDERHLLFEDGNIITKTVFKEPINCIFTVTEGTTKVPFVLDIAQNEHNIIRKELNCDRTIKF